jgi:hypothetical protein
VRSCLFGGADEGPAAPWGAAAIGEVASTPISLPGHFDETVMGTPRLSEPVAFPQTSAPNCGESGPILSPARTQVTHFGVARWGSG